MKMISKRKFWTVLTIAGVMAVSAAGFTASAAEAAVPEGRTIITNQDGDQYLLATGETIDLETRMVDGRERIVLTNQDGDKYLLATGDVMPVETAVVNGETRIVLTNQDGDKYLLASHIADDEQDDSQTYTWYHEN